MYYIVFGYYVIVQVVLSFSKLVAKDPTLQSGIEGGDNMRGAGQSLKVNKRGGVEKL